MILFALCHKFVEVSVCVLSFTICFSLFFIVFISFKLFLFLTLENLVLFLLVNKRKICFYFKNLFYLVLYENLFRS